MCCLHASEYLVHRVQAGSTALLYSVQGNHAACVSLLLEWGADATVTNSHGRTAMEVAIKDGYRHGESNSPSRVCGQEILLF